MELADRRQWMIIVQKRERPFEGLFTCHRAASPFSDQFVGAFRQGEQLRILARDRDHLGQEIREVFDREEWRRFGFIEHPSPVQTRCVWIAWRVRSARESADVPANAKQPGATHRAGRGLDLAIDHVEKGVSPLNELVQ